MTELLFNNSFSPLPTLFIIPSGIGCEIGGFAGDAIPCARLLSVASGLLITHPNVLNGASLYWSDPRIQYVEGYGLDRFAAGEIALRKVTKQKIGLLLDAGIEPELIQRHLEVVNACRASLGIDVSLVVKTDVPLEINLRDGSSGTSWGILRNPESLLNAGEKLKSSGVTAIAVVTRFPDENSGESSAVDLYRRGQGVDSLAGAEAVISHLLVRHLSIPCAHAPALNPLPISEDLDPRAAAEELSHTFLACVLVGLSKAPDMVSLTKDVQLNDLSVNQLGAVVVPATALGGEALLACVERKIPVIGVENSSMLNVNAQALGIMNEQKQIKDFDYYPASNYLEAAGLILSLREGISRDSLYRPLKDISKGSL